MTRRSNLLFGLLACALLPLASGCASDGGAFAGVSPSVAPKAAGPDPTFSYSGDPQCAITYKSDGTKSMSWTATATATATVTVTVTVTVGELDHPRPDNQGDTNRRDQQMAPGPNHFSAPEPLNDIGDIGGVLYAGSKSYGCSIRPAR